MRWVVFLVLAVPILTAQSALSQRMELFGARPDWLLVLVVFVALHARRHDAVLGAWVLGMAADLMTKGLKDYLVKPVEREKLLAVVGKMVAAGKGIEL